MSLSITARIYPDTRVEYLSWEGSHWVHVADVSIFGDVADLQRLRNAIDACIEAQVPRDLAAA